MNNVSIYYSPKFDEVILITSNENGIKLEDGFDIYKVDQTEVPVIVGLNYELIGYFEDDK